MRLWGHIENHSFNRPSKPIWLSHLLSTCYFKGHWSRSLFLSLHHSDSLFQNPYSLIEVRWSTVVGLLANTDIYFGIMFKFWSALLPSRTPPKFWVHSLIWPIVVHSWFYGSSDNNLIADISVILLAGAMGTTFGRIRTIKFSQTCASDTTTIYGGIQNLYEPVHPWVQCQWLGVDTSLAVICDYNFKNCQAGSGPT